MRLNTASPLLLVIFACLVGCDRGTEPAGTVPADAQREPAVVEPAAGGTTEQAYEIRGTVTAIDREAARVTIDHEEIEGLMSAMTMPFEVAVPEVLEGLEEGSEVQGQLVKRDGRYVITNLTQ